MDQLKYVSPEYQQQLEDLADTLMEKRREKVAEELGQMALFEVHDESGTR